MEGSKMILENSKLYKKIILVRCLDCGKTMDSRKDKLHRELTGHERFVIETGGKNG